MIYSKSKTWVLYINWCSKRARKISKLWSSNNDSILCVYIVFVYRMFLLYKSKILLSNLSFKLKIANNGWDNSRLLQLYVLIPGPRISVKCSSWRADDCRAHWIPQPDPFSIQLYEPIDPTNIALTQAWRNDVRSVWLHILQLKLSKTKDLANYLFP